MLGGQFQLPKVIHYYHSSYLSTIASTYITSVQFQITAHKTNILLFSVDHMDTSNLTSSTKTKLRNDWLC